MGYREALMIVNRLIDEYDVDASVYESYSGRGMFGEETTGIVVPPDALMMVGFVAGELGLEADDLPTRRDSMGLDMIVY